MYKSFADNQLDYEVIRAKIYLSIFKNNRTSTVSSSDGCQTNVIARIDLDLIDLSLYCHIQTYSHRYSRSVPNFMNHSTDFFFWNP